MSNVQPGSSLALSNHVNAVEHCSRCDAPIKLDEVFLSADDFGEPFCSLECLAEYDQARLEEAYENIYTPRD